MHRPGTALAVRMPQGARGMAEDVLTLAKPKIIVLLFVTCACGALVAAGGNAGLLGWHVAVAMVGLVLSASGANMVNMWWDRDIDPLMTRTKNRPLPQGRIRPGTVLAMGVALVAVGWGLAAVAGWLAGLMCLAGALFYIVVYTMLLKRRTVYNIVIGGAAGAFPPLVGWAAVQGNLSSPLPWLMFLIVFLWTPPHFWSLALVSNADYTRARIPMYPVVYGEAATRQAIMRYLTLLVPVTLAGGLSAPLGWLYTGTSLALGAWWIHAAVRLLQAAKPTAENKRPAQQVFAVSLMYLALLFAVMVVDSWL